MYRDLAREDFIIMQPQGRSNDEAEEVLICYNKGGFIPNIVAREREVQTVLLEVSAGIWRGDSSGIRRPPLSECAESGSGSASPRGRQPGRT